LTIEKRKNGPDIWVYRWRESIGNGQIIKRKRIIGTKKEFPTQSGAWRSVEALRWDINAESVSVFPLTIAELAEHYKTKELGEAGGKTAKTCETYAQHIDDYIIPRWGSERVGEMKGFRVEEWLRALDRADGTKAKTKAVFSVLYQHAMRFGWAERNPIREVRQSAKRLREPDVLSTKEVSTLHSWLRLDNGSSRHRHRSAARRVVWVEVARYRLRKRGYSRVPLDSRSSRWGDEDRRFQASYSHGIRVSLCPERMAATNGYSKPSDWVFASPYHDGRTAYWPGTVLEKVIRPAALNARHNKAGRVAYVPAHRRNVAGGEW